MAIDLTVTHLSGSKQGTVDTVRGNPVWLGRAEKCQIRFDPEADRKVSALHAELREAAGEITIHDLGSRNGVLVNGVQIEGSAPLPNRATIQLGKDGPRVRVDFEPPSGGIDFQRVRRDTRRKLDKDEVLKTPSLLSTDESLTAYTPEQLGLSDAPPQGNPHKLKILGALVLALALVLLFLAFK